MSSTLNTPCQFVSLWNTNFCIFWLYTLYGNESHTHAQKQSCHLYTQKGLKTFWFDKHNFLQSTCRQQTSNWQHWLPASWPWGHASCLTTNELTIRQAFLWQTFGILDRIDTTRVVYSGFPSQHWTHLCNYTHEAPLCQTECMHQFETLKGYIWVNLKLNHV